MFLKKSFIFIPSVFLLLNLFPIESHGQKAKLTIPKRKYQKKFLPKKVISFGVINAKAINLVKPEYSPSARFVNVKGSVNVRVLIDETGDVIEAKINRGHPFLIPAALKAARSSKFEPFILESGQRLKVSGVIVYNFVSNSMNWLELGFNSDSIRNLQDFLPFDFEGEKEVLRQAENYSPEEKLKVLEMALISIDGKLISDTKNFWLFSVGKNLNLLARNHWRVEKKREILGEIRLLLYSTPSNISPILLKKIEDLSSTLTKEIFDENLAELLDQLYAL